MVNGLLMTGIFLLLCGIFVLCIAVVVMIVLGCIKYMHNEESQKNVIAAAENSGSKMDGALLKQWNNLLGYNGDEGDDIDE